MKKKKRYLAALVVGVLLATAVLSGCGQSKKEISKNDDHLTVYLWENRLMKNIAPYIQEQFPDHDIEFIVGNNDTDLYSYFEEHGELPDIITVRRFSGTDAQDLQPYLMDFRLLMMWFPGITPMHCNTIKIQKMKFSGFLFAVSRRQLLPTRHCLISMESRFRKTMKNMHRHAQQFYDNGIKPYSLDLAEDWSAHEVIQTGAIGEFMSLDGIQWRSSAESASGDIAFDRCIYGSVFSQKPIHF